MDKKKSEFDKVFSAWDILVIAFGAMIGWGWVVSSGDWIQRGGVLGAMIGFALGGVMIFFVGLTYAELTAAMPQCGGEHVFSYKAMGPIGSFICTWAIVLGYVSVVCFEACALPTIITYIYPGFLKGYLYTVAGFDIYASWLAVAILVAIFMTIINILGAKTAAVLQTVLTVIIGGVGLLLIASSVVTGDVANLETQLFVGDSASNVMAGNVTTLPITLDQMIYHAKSVVRGVKRAMVVVDMPFGSYQGNEMEGLASAIRIMKESHADALKLEGGEEIIDTVKRIISAGIPVMGHLGLMPQSINKYGTYTVRAKDDAEADKLIRDAHLLEEAGCFAIVLEKIPATLAERVAAELTIPIIGIGAGGHVDGQVLVIQDMLGMNNGFRPRFLRRYADLYTVMTDAISRYVSDVKNCYFPNEKEQY